MLSIPRFRDNVRNRVALETTLPAVSFKISEIKRDNRKLYRFDTYKIRASSFSIEMSWNSLIRNNLCNIGICLSILYVGLDIDIRAIIIAVSTGIKVFD